MSKPIFTIEMLKEDTSKMTNLQKAKAIRAWAERRGRTAEQRKFALKRAGLYEYKHRQSKKAKSPKPNTGLWQVSVDEHGTKVFKNNGATLYGITPQEFALFEKAKSKKTAKRKTTNARAKSKKRA